jgi:hypothetical protein
MSLIFDAAANTPQTHILLIAVGGYPFLKGGATPKVQTLESAKNIGQLTSPGASMVAYYNKMMEYHTQNEWSKPLGSLEILFTPHPDAQAVLPPGLNIENASIENIQNAYVNWKNRCDQHADNVALFIFCGHGAEKDHQYLLADDFGKSLANPWQEAFNFDLTKMAFKSCKAQTQIFFVDACRQITSDMLTTVPTVQPLELPSQLLPDSRYNFTIKAAASNQAAHGMENKPSYFTNALLMGLDGLVARKDQNNWIVETGRLSAHINDLMQLANAPELTTQRCQTFLGNSIDILRRDEAPNTWLEISCDPDHALPLAALSYSELNQAAIIDSRPPDPNPWKFNVKAGIYTLTANFQAGGFQNKTHPVSAIPPITRETIPCI